MVEAGDLGSHLTDNRIVSWVLGDLVQKVNLPPSFKLCSPATRCHDTMIYSYILRSADNMHHPRRLQLVGDLQRGGPSGRVCGSLFGPVMIMELDSWNS